MISWKTIRDLSKSLLLILAASFSLTTANAELPDDSSVEGGETEAALTCQSGCKNPQYSGSLTQCETCVVELVDKLTHERGKEAPPLSNSSGKESRGKQ